MKTSLLAYFNAMRSSGALSVSPEMAMKFFMTNITGSIMKDVMTARQAESDETYFQRKKRTELCGNETGMGRLHRQKDLGVPENRPQEHADRLP